MFVLRAFQSNNLPVQCERWQFTHLPIRIGRSPDNDYCPQHPAISAFHAQIEEFDGKLCIRDLGSRNGVFVPTAARDATVRVGSNDSVDLSTGGYLFYLSECVCVQLMFAQEVARLHDRGPAIVDGVLGNIEMIAQPGHQLAVAPEVQQAPHQKSTALVPQALGQPEHPGPHRFAPAPTDPPPGHAAALDNAGTARARPKLSNRPTDGEAPESQFFEVDLDYLALQGLRELARSLVPGRSLDTTGDVARLITKLHDTVDVFCRCFIPLRQGYEQFISSLNLATHSSINYSPSAAALNTASTPEAVSAALLDPHDRSLDAPQAAERILTDLARHQVALLDGVMQGVRALLHELSPERIEAELSERGVADLFGSKYRSRWTEFCERYQRLSEECQAFAVIFGQDFADAYRQYWQRESIKEPRPANDAKDR